MKKPSLRTHFRRICSGSGSPMPKAAPRASHLRRRRPGFLGAGALPTSGRPLLSNSYQEVSPRAQRTSVSTKRSDYQDCSFILVSSTVAQTVKNLPAMQETLGWSLGWEDPLEKDMATRSSILAWRILWTEELDRLQSMQPMGSQRVGHD